jgi:hypothetical protein
VNFFIAGLLLFHLSRNGGKVLLLPRQGGGYVFFRGQYRQAVA